MHISFILLGRINIENILMPFPAVKQFEDYNIAWRNLALSKKIGNYLNIDFAISKPF